MAHLPRRATSSRPRFLGSRPKWRTIGPGYYCMTPTPFHMPQHANWLHHASPFDGGVCTSDQPIDAPRKNQPSTAFRIATAFATLPDACSSPRASLIDATHCSAEPIVAGADLPLFDAFRPALRTLLLDLTR